MMFEVYGTYGTVYNHDICINISKTTGTPKNGDYLPYQHASLSLPSTRLDGVGAAQDYIKAVEVGENDYSLILHGVMDLVNLGTLDWNYQNGAGHLYFRAPLPEAKRASSGVATANIICPMYTNDTGNNVYNNVTDKTIAIPGDANRVMIYDTAYTDKDALTSALNGVYLCFEKATPTQTTIAEHLTLAQVSAIAENGGIIGIVNSNGDIVQPDAVFDTVISRSAS